MPTVPGAEEKGPENYRNGRGRKLNIDREPEPINMVVIYQKVYKGKPAIRLQEQLAFQAKPTRMPRSVTASSQTAVIAAELLPQAK